MDAMLGRMLGHYELVARLGSGGMGTVYRGVHQTLRQPRAVKVLRPDLSNEADVVARFRREAMIAAGLRHPNIVLIYDVAEQDGLHYLVMDLLEGGTLRDIIRSSAPLPIQRAVDLLRPLASALDYAHAHGVMHRDVKPGNVLVSADGHVTLVDFGIARAAEEARLTRAGTVVGTAEYMAPEAFTGDGSDQNGDRYALGVIAYELLTGKAPFRGTPSAVSYAQINTPPPPARTLHPGVSARVEQALLSQLAKDPAERFPDAKRFVEAIALSVGRVETLDAPTMMIPQGGVNASTPWPMRSTPPAAFPSLASAKSPAPPPSLVPDQDGSAGPLPDQVGSPAPPDPHVAPPPLAAGTALFQPPPKVEQPPVPEAALPETPPGVEPPSEQGTVIFRAPPKPEEAPVPESAPPKTPPGVEPPRLESPSVEPPNEQGTVIFRAPPKSEWPPAPEAEPPDAPPLVGEPEPGQPGTAMFEAPPDALPLPAPGTAIFEAAPGMVPSAADVPEPMVEPTAALHQTAPDLAEPADLIHEPAVESYEPASALDVLPPDPDTRPASGDARWRTMVVALLVLATVLAAILTWLLATR